MHNKAQVANRCFHLSSKTPHWSGFACQREAESDSCRWGKRPNSAAAQTPQVPWLGAQTSRYQEKPCISLSFEGLVIWQRPALSCLVNVYRRWCIHLNLWNMCRWRDIYWVSLRKLWWIQMSFGWGLHVTSRGNFIYFLRKRCFLPTLCRWTAMAHFLAYLVTVVATHTTLCCLDIAVTARYHGQIWLLR